MKKRFLALFLALALVCAMLPATLLTASAETYSGTCGENLTWTLDTETGVLEISGTGGMSSDYYAPWFSYRESIKDVQIGSGVSNISDFAFSDYTGLTSVTIPDSVTSIGREAFRGCTGLISITVDENNSIYDSRGDCNAIIETATNTLISGCMNTTIPDSVTSICDYAFYGCTGLTSVTIPDSVTSIGDHAFYGCTGLTSLTIGNNVTSIGSSAFFGCEWLSAVYISNLAAWCEINHEIINANPLYYAKKLYLNGALITDLVIPEGVTRIGQGAFCNCSSLTSVTIPDSVTSIGNSAFEYCQGLTSVTIGSGVTSIGREAFFLCTHLTSVTIPEGVTSIGDHAFYDCYSLTSVTIPEGVTTIEADTFYICEELKSVAIPKSVTRIGTNAFDGCDKLTDVYYPGTEAEWNAILIKEGNDCLTKAKIHYNYVVHVHSYTDVVTPPTCTEQGYTTHTCACGDSYVDTYVPALGHNYVDGVCTRCGAKEHEPVSFNDVSPNAWYYGAVDYAVSNGLMNGVGNGNFAPDSPMTRAMLVTVLWRYEGEPKEGKNTFTDVPDGQWYTQAVAWAAANGIVGGVGNGKFDPNGNITREQMATILYRYADKKGFDTSKRGDLNSFPDAGKVSSWAKDAIAWAVAESIIGGADGKLLPQGNATRAQVSTILMRFIENIAKK